MTLALDSGLWAQFRGLFGHAQGTAATNIDVDGDVKRAYEKTLSINIDPTTNINANTTLRHFFKAKRDVDIQEVLYVSDAALDTTDTGNYLEIRVLSGSGAAAAATVVASANSAETGNFVAGTGVTFTNVTAELALDAGNTLGYDVKKYGTAGSTPACPKGALVIHYRER